MKYEKKHAPIQHANAPRSGFAPAALTIGAQIPAAVTIATVPEPCTKRTSVEMMNGNNTIGIEAAANCSAIKAPVQESFKICPKEPPAPVTKIIIPALAKPLLISLRTSSLGTALASV